MTNRTRLLAVASIAAMASAGPAHATVTLLGSFSGNECQGGFSTCYANQNGTTSQNSGDARSIFKYNSDATTAISTQFPSINGSEFSVTYTQNTNQLSFTYTPGSGDPVIHYYVINQANTSYLFYDSAAITSGTIALSSYFPKNPGYSHITFFGAAASAVPELSSWAMMIAGFGAMGVALRRRPRVTVAYA